MNGYQPTQAMASPPHCRHCPDVTARPPRQYWVMLIAFGLFVLSLPFEAVDMGAWSRSSAGAGSVTLVSLAKLVGYVFFLTTLLEWRRSFGRRSTALICFAVYLAIYAATGMFGPYPDEALTRTFTLAQMLVLFYASSNLLTEERTRLWVTAGLGVACAAYSALVLVGVLNEGMVQTTGSGATVSRVSGLAEDPNTVATVLALGFLAMLGIATGGQRRHPFFRAAAWVSLPGIGYVIIQTGSRGGALALGCGLLVFAFTERSAKAVACKALVMALILAFVFVSILSQEYVLQRWESTIHDGSLAGRDTIARESIGLILDKPLIGWGPVAADYALGAACGTGIRGTHNLWLAVLLENGMLGSVFYAVAVGLCLRGAWRARRGTAGVLPLALVVTVLVANLSVRWDIYKLHWLVLAFGLAVEPQAWAVPVWARRPCVAVAPINRMREGHDGHVQT